MAGINGMGGFNPKVEKPKAQEKDAQVQESVTGKNKKAGELKLNTCVIVYDENGKQISRTDFDDGKNVFVIIDKNTNTTTIQDNDRKTKTTIYPNGQVETTDL